MNHGPTRDRCMTVDEVARALGIGVRTVIRDEQRALRKLRLALEVIAEHLAIDGSPQNSAPARK